MHHPVDDRAAYFEIMIEPTVVFGVDHNWTMSSFVLCRQATRLSQNFCPGSFQFVPAIANEIHDRICNNDFPASHHVPVLSLSSRSSSRPRHCSDSQNGQPNVVARIAATRYVASSRSFGSALLAGARFAFAAALSVRPQFSVEPLFVLLCGLYSARARQKPIDFAAGNHHSPGNLRST